MRPGRQWYLVAALVAAIAFVVLMVVVAATNGDGGMDEDMPGMDMGLGGGTGRD